MIINSEPKVIETSDKDVFDFLSDFNNFQKLMPEQIINWQSTPDSCSFTIKGMADLKLKIVEKNPVSQIVISSESSKPFDFNLTWLIERINDNKTNAQLIFEGKINPMMSLMVKSPLQNFVNILVQKLKEYF